MSPPDHLRTLRQYPICEADHRRIAMTVSCDDCASIPKVQGAGEVREQSPWPVQVMHNGVLIAQDSYCGPWMTKLIHDLKGHHEPQEEKAFHTVLSSLSNAATMVELGSYWSYYSLWFLQKFPHAKTILVEPDPNLLQIGKFNFELNQRQGTFIHAAVADRPSQAVPFRCESDGAEHPVPRVSADSLIEDLHLDKIDLLLADIQGAELEMLQGLENAVRNGRISYLFLSTHDAAISGDFLIHEKCLNWIKERGGNIVVEHTVEESFSGDGLIVASFDPAPRLTVNISHNRASNSLFGSPSLRLAEMAQRLAAIKSPPEPAILPTPPPSPTVSEAKTSKQRLKRCSAAITRRLRLDSTPKDSITSLLFNARRLKAWLTEHRLQKSVLSRLHSLRKKRKTEVVLGLHGLFEVLKDEQVVSPVIINELQWEFGLLARVIKLVETTTGKSLKSATILDIGANIGMVGLQIVSSGLMKRCVSFEPDPTNFALMWSNVRLNGLEDRFLLQPAALGAKSGECQFEVSTSNCGDHRVRTKEHERAGEKYDESGREVISVPMRTLDDVLDKCPGDFKRSIGLCWIDVQGFEGEVLKGGEKQFCKHSWPSVLEFWPYGMNRAGIDAATFASIVGKAWTKFVVLEEGNEVWHPISHIGSIWKSVGLEGDFVNLLMMP